MRRLVIALAVLTGLALGCTSQQERNAEFVEDVRDDSRTERLWDYSDSELLDAADQMCADIEEVGADRYFDSVTEEMYREINLGETEAILAFARHVIDHEWC